MAGLQDSEKKSKAKKPRQRDPRQDPEVGDVLKDPEGFYLYVQGRSPRMVWAQPFGEKRPMLWCSQLKLGFWRRKAKDCEVTIVSQNRVFSGF